MSYSILLDDDDDRKYQNLIQASMSTLSIKQEKDTFCMWLIDKPNCPC